MDKSNSGNIADEAIFEAQADQVVPKQNPHELDLATLIDIQPSGTVQIKFSGRDETVSAISTVPLDKAYIGRQVAVMYTQVSPPQAVVIGLIRTQLDNLLEVIEVADDNVSSEDDHVASPVQTEKSFEVDGKRVALTGQEEVVLKCGAASITLTKAGKIVIRGKSLLNRASGVNRIMGGSVQVN